MISLDSLNGRINRFRSNLVHQPLNTVVNVIFSLLMLFGSVMILVLMFFMLYILFTNSLPMFERFGLSNIFESKWHSEGLEFGFLPFIQGTVVTSIISITIAVPVSVGVSLFVTQYIENIKVKNGLKFTIELIAAIPSVVIGLWGIAVLLPLLGEFVIPPLKDLLFFLPEPTLQSNYNIFTASIALVIMIVPIITAVTISIMDRVPDSQKEAAFALGATSWEMSRMTVIPLTKRGTFGASILGLGRALGETMAVTMLIGGDISTFTSIFEPGSSITAIITSEWGEAVSKPIARAAFLELALILLLISLIINLIAKFLITRGASTGTGRMEEA